MELDYDNYYEMVLWNTLQRHIGHNIEIVQYGDPAVDVCLECIDCGEVILDAELYTICMREDK